MSAPLIRCFEARPYLSAYVDGELDAGLAGRIDEHLASCAGCRRTVAKYRYVDELIGRLPAPGPSPEVLDRVLAATSSVNRERAVRQSLRGPEKPLAPRSLPAFILADTNLAAPVSARHAANQSRRGLVLARALPTLAALLIIALTLVSFHGRPGQTSSVRHSTPYPSPASQVALAEQQVNKYGLEGKLSALGFVPVLPTTLPSGVRFDRASLPTMDTGQEYLDVAFSLDPPFTDMHLREIRVPLGARTDYVLQTPNALQTWQIPGSYQWRNMVDKGNTGRLVVGEDRGPFSVTLDIGQRGGDLYLVSSPQAGRALTDLRLTSLSIDSPYQYLGAISAPGGTMVVHYTMQTTGAVDGKPYQWDVYWNKLKGEGSAALYTSTSSGALGTKLYTDYRYGYRVARCTPLDRCENYALSSPQVTHDPFGVSSKVQTFLNTISDYVRDGELWNLGPPQTGAFGPGIGTIAGLEIGTTALDVLAYVDGPYPIWVYVDAATLRVAAVISQINLPDTTAPGGKNAQSPLSSFGGCAVSYPQLVYLDTQSTALPNLGAPAPLGYQSITTVPTCSP